MADHCPSSGFDNGWCQTHEKETLSTRWPTIRYEWQWGLLLNCCSYFVLVNWHPEGHLGLWWWVAEGLSADNMLGHLHIYPNADSWDQWPNFFCGKYSVCINLKGRAWLYSVVCSSSVGLGSQDWGWWSECSQHIHDAQFWQQWSAPEVCWVGPQEL